MKLNLSEDELNTKGNKNVYVENDVMTTVIKRLVVYMRFLSQFQTFYYYFFLR